MNTTHKRSEVEQKSDVAKREETILQFWREQDIFQKTLKKKAPKGDYIFYDGPPFATGLPHYGHILAGTIKDAVPRFWTMKGYHVPRKWGWDCHGLPLENLIEKELGLATKRDIEEYGVQNFNEKARGAVMRYADDWREIIPRMGRFVDMDDDYKTMDSSYTESVWWVFSELNKKGLVYEGFKSMHLCPRCGTTLSNFEVNQGYKDIKDIAVTVKLPLLDGEGKVTDTSLLVWTTTPWTLPGNMAAAVHNEYDYVKFKEVSIPASQDLAPGEEMSKNAIPTYDPSIGSEFFVMAKEVYVKTYGLEPKYEVVEEMKGNDLVGRRYQPPFPYLTDQDFEGKENAWTIYHADYVELGEEGTGAVHLAPAYGADDMALAQAHGVPIVHHVDEAGHFMDFVSDFAGQLVKPKDDEAAEVSHLDADIEIVKALKAKGTLFRKENINHSYPHCWRCDTPLLNYATTSWFVKVTDFSEALVKENEKIHWVPEHVGRARFGKWLEGARDWAVSRQRYWGAPLPVWRQPQTKEVCIVGSLQELQEYVPTSGNTYLLMRHGEAESNVQGVISTKEGAGDALTEAGKAQVVEATKKLASESIDLIVTSPFARTKETARLVADALGLPEEAVVVDERLREVQLPDEMQGESWDVYRAEFASLEAEYEDHDALQLENKRAMQRRAGELLFEYEASHKSKRIVFIGHKSSLFGIASAAKGITKEQAAELKEEYWLENAEIKEVTFTPYPHNDDYVLDFHRPYIDNIELYSEGVKLERVPDVFDCWFESGSMPYGQQHFLGEAVPDFDPAKGKGYPADFIAESIDQTRGWFYSLIVLGTALFGQSPYKNVVTNGLVLAEDGRKMSKSLQNYPDPVELVERQGADAMRFYLLSSSIIKGEDLNFSEKEVQELQRKNIGRLHNVLSMYNMFQPEDEGSRVEARADSPHVLDRWIGARRNELVRDITAGYTHYELDKATRPITDFIDDLSVWYLRRSRDRLKSDDIADSELALGTLRYVLDTLAKVMAPIMPFYAEHLYQAVKASGAPESVHLCDWPEENEVDGDVLQKMTAVREVVTLALEARTKASVKVRQPLPTLTINSTMDAEYSDIVADEVNVKTVESDTAKKERVELDTTITPELKLEGEAREFMRAVQGIRKEAGLAQHDRVVLTVQASDGGQAMVKAYEEMIMKTVGATGITFEDADGTEVTAGEHSFTVEVTPVS